MALNSLKDLLSDNKALSVLKLDGVEFKDLRFPNNESYRGGWRDARVGVAAPAARQFVHKLRRVLRCISARVPFCLSDSQVLEHAPGSAVGVRPPCSLSSIPHTTSQPPQPEGEGCYTWADGSTYEGAWHAGLKHGWGTYRWPNGAWYCGEWRDGFMQVRTPVCCPCGWWVQGVVPCLRAAWCCCAE